MPGPSTQPTSSPADSDIDANRAFHAERAESDSNTERGKALATLKRNTKSEIDSIIQELRGKLLKVATDEGEDFSQVLLAANFYCYYEPTSNGTVHRHNVAIGKKRTIWNTFFQEEFKRLNLPADGDEGLFSQESVERYSTTEGDDCPSWAKPMRNKCKQLSLLYRSISPERKKDLERKTAKYNEDHAAKVAIAGAVDCDIQATANTSEHAHDTVLDASEQARKRDLILNDFSKEMKAWGSLFERHGLEFVCSYADSRKTREGVVGTNVGILWEKSVLRVLESGSEEFGHYCRYQSNINRRTIYVQAIRLGMFPEIERSVKEKTDKRLRQQHEKRVAAQALLEAAAAAERTAAGVKGPRRRNKKTKNTGTAAPAPPVDNPVSPPQDSDNMITSSNTANVNQNSSPPVTSTTMATPVRAGNRMNFQPSSSASNILPQLRPVQPDNTVFNTPPTTNSPSTLFTQSDNTVFTTPATRSSNFFTRSDSTVFTTPPTSSSAPMANYELLQNYHQLNELGYDSMNRQERLTTILNHENPSSNIDPPPTEAQLDFVNESFDPDINQFERTPVAALGINGSHIDLSENTLERRDAKRSHIQDSLAEIWKTHFNPEATTWKLPRRSTANSTLAKAGKRWVLPDGVDETKLYNRNKPANDIKLLLQGLRNGTVTIAKA